MEVDKETRDMWKVYLYLSSCCSNDMPPTIPEISRRLHMDEKKTAKELRKLKDLGLVGLQNYFRVPQESMDGEWDFDRTQMYGRRYTTVGIHPDTNEGRIAEAIDLCLEVQDCMWMDDCFYECNNRGRKNGKGFPIPPFGRYILTEDGHILESDGKEATETDEGNYCVKYYVFNDKQEEEFRKSTIVDTSEYKDILEEKRNGH